MLKLSDEVNAILSEWSAVREVARICDKDGPLEDALRSLCDELRRAARRQSPLFANWQATPYRESRSIGLTLSAFKTWCCHGEPLGVFFWFPSLSDPEWRYDNPYVSFRVPEAVPHAELLREKLSQHMPTGFTKDYLLDERDPADVFWKSFLIDDSRFIGHSEWKSEAFLSAVLEAMEQAASVRPIVDEFLSEMTAQAG